MFHLCSKVISKVILGESGSGKSTCGKALLGILPASAKICQGLFSFKDDAPRPLSLMENRWKQLRGKNIALIHQDAKLALNPLKTIQEHFRETLLSHGMLSQTNIDKEGLEILSKLNFSAPDIIYKAYPFELSGGMCQRIYIALCLCLQPEVLIADEPTSALDVVSQKDVLDMLKNIRDKFAVAILLITHDVGVAYAVSDRVIVLNKGKIVEEGNAQKILLQPCHPYTKELVSARQLLSAPVRKGCCFSDCLLQVNGLCKCFSKAKAEQKILKELSFVLNKGEILGVLGQSGCGNVCCRTHNSGFFSYQWFCGFIRLARSRSYQKVLTFVLWKRFFENRSRRTQWFSPQEAWLCVDAENFAAPF